MTEQYAILDQVNGHLVNTVVWDGDAAKWQPPAGTTAVRLADLDLSTLPPAPAQEGEKYTAEQWVSQHLTTMQLTALADLRVSLVLANKPLGEKMSAMRDWTSGIIASWASDPTPRSDWELPPCSYDEAAQEAVGDLQG